MRGVSNPLTENTGAIKIDYHISDNDSLSGRYNVNNSLTQNYFGVARGQIQTAPGHLALIKLTYTHTFTPHLLNEAGFGFNRVHIDPRSADSEEIRAFPIVALGSGSAGVGPATFDLNVANNSLTYLDTLSWVKGNHQLKFGAQIIRNQDNKALLFQRTVTYLNLDDFAINSPFSIGTLGQPRRGMRNTYENFFVQDDILLTRSITINAGLRYQYDTSPTEASGVLANFDPAKGALDTPGTQLINAPKNNFAPRLGIAWSPFGASGTVFRGGFGMFYGTLNAALAQNVPNNVFAAGHYHYAPATTRSCRVSFPNDHLFRGGHELHGVAEELEDRLHGTVESQRAAAGWQGSDGTSGVYRQPRCASGRHLQPESPLFGYRGAAVPSFREYHNDPQRPDLEL